MGIAQAALGQTDAAVRAFEAAASLFEAAGNIPMLCNVLLQQSVLSQQQAQVGQAQVGQALAQVQRVVTLCSRGAWPLQLAEAHLRLAELTPASSDPSGTLLEQAQRLVESIDLPRLHTRLQTLLGRAAVDQGNWAQAEVHFEAAIEQIEAHRARLDRTQLRAAFGQDKHAAYSDLIQVLLAREAEARHILTWVERARARALVEMLAGTRVNRAQGSGRADTDTRQATQIAMLQARLSALYTKMMLGPGETSAEDFVQLQTEAIEVERQISRAQMHAALQSPSPADPIVTPLHPDEIQARLPAEVAVLNYYICKDEVIAFILTHESLQLVRAVTTAALVQDLLDRLRQEWQHFQLDEGFVRKHLPQMEKSVKKVLYALHQAILDALKPALAALTSPSPLPASGPAQPRKLVVVPHGPLHAIPFQALFDGAAYVIDAHEVSYAPSCTAYVLGQGRPVPATSRAVVLGNADALIPNVAAEARAVAQLLDDSSLYLNESATLAAFQAHAPGCRRLHVACHGLFRTDSPMFSALKLHDGWLKAIDVLEVDLTGASVVLSACDSGRSKVWGGDELMGLVRAFLGAGAASLLVSLWLVRDESTAMLMTAWYAHMQLGLGPCQALRAAQLHTRARFSHPYYWAPFILIGQRE
jgi:CHAT domain-containing protein